MKKTIAIDFDGVLIPHDTHENENRKPREGAIEFIKKLSKDFNIIIFTTEDVKKVLMWMTNYNLISDIELVTNTKPKIDIYLDDRGLQFNGNYNKAFEDIKNFKPYWE